MALENPKLLEAIQRIAKAVEAIARKTDPEFKTRHQRQVETMRGTRKTRTAKRAERKS